MYYILLTLILLGLYIALTINLQPSNLFLGGIISAMIIALLRPEPRQIALRRLPLQLWALLRYMLLLAIDLIKSGVTVARIVLHPSMPIKPGIIAIPAPCNNDSALALSAHALTLTPGEMVVETGDDCTLYTHCLDATRSQEYIANAGRLRSQLLQKIIE